MNVVGDQHPLDCGVILTVTCYRRGEHYTRSEYFPESLIKGHSLAKIGTILQRQVFEALRLAYSKALAESDEPLSGEQMLVDN